MSTSGLRSDGSTDGDLARWDGSLVMGLPTDTLFSSQWHLHDASGWDIRVVPVWEDYDGSGVSVSVYDQGVDTAHTDLDGNIDLANQRSAVTKATDGAPVDSGDNHGTAVAGLIAAERNGVGVVGVAYASTIVPIYDPLSGSTADLSARLTYGYQHASNFDVSNHSWGFGNAFYYSANAAFIDNFKEAPSAAAGAALETAVATGRSGLGTVFVQSAGNGHQVGDNVNLHSYQASRHTVTVAATEQDGSITSYSTHGAAVLVAAPGSPSSGTIVTTDRTGSAGYSSTDYTASFNGTSAAAPIVSGVVALMLDANPELGWRDVQEILAYSARLPEPAARQTNGATDWNGGGVTVSHAYGAGIVDAQGAVRLAETWEGRHFSANTETATAGRTVGATIPGGGELASTVFIGDDIEIEHVEVDIDIRHAWIGDLVVKLVSPSGTQSVLMDRPGRSASSTWGSSQDNVDFVFGSTLHWGESSRGTWQLLVGDAEAAYDTGTLSDWSLKVYGKAASDDDTYVFTDDFAHFRGDDGAERRFLDDRSGVDVINASAVTSHNRLDLRPGNGSDIAGTPLVLSGATIIERAYAGDGADEVIGNQADNRIDGGRGDDWLFGLDGDDRLIGGTGNDRLDGGNGNDSLSAGQGRDKLFGGNGDDRLEGEWGADWLFGDDGRDTLFGGTDADRLDGGAADDRLFGGSHNDKVIGRAGDDVLVGEDGDDFLFGNEGNDVLDGGAGGDKLLGDEGDDRIEGAGGADRLFGGAGNDRLFGGNDDDLIEGGTGADKLYGGAGNDTLDGQADGDDVDAGPGDDIVRGGSGADAIWAGQGNDQIWGGDGRDRFVYKRWDERGDTINDFEIAGADHDVVEIGEMLASLGYAGSDAFGDGWVRVNHAGGDSAVQIDADGGGDGFVDLTQVLGVDLTAVDATDYILI